MGVSLCFLVTSKQQRPRTPVPGRTVCLALKGGPHPGGCDKRQGRGQAHGGPLCSLWDPAWHPTWDMRVSHVRSHLLNISPADIAGILTSIFPNLRTFVLSCFLSTRDTSWNCVIFAIACACTTEFYVVSIYCFINYAPKT